MKNQKTILPKKTPVRKTTRKKRSLPELHYHINRFSDYQYITNSKKTSIFVFLNLIQAVKEGIETNVEKIPFVKLKGTRATIWLPRTSWKKSLTSALEFLTQIELYESCAKCKELLDKL